MRRRICVILSVLSLLLCMAVVTLWVHSYWASDCVLLRINDPQRLVEKEFFVRSELGAIRLARNRFDHSAWSAARRAEEPAPLDGVYWFSGELTDHVIPVSGWERWQFGAGRHTSADGTMAHTAIKVPHWAIALLFSVPLLAVAMPALRRRRRAALGLCLACGYDLRASKERCPECGTQIRMKDEGGK